mmetsp:Transcript_5604/g.12434  ORF Transcript_5604/g.12434 Transcript_5604/m.12434 type:complete len:260 (+) Transcript_5604:60-839(+)|eukprot:CAMPEP_0116823476 /NCGR_PEP_ID=MMETSP0418-20121206/856_1 /TAXON_ID=1158023 /ORGANISM="Astrosyne radiata, Strain 13vi08-1A" /LENGTH=259 /DNA_ID=CAMNT_0004451727 /DNA_START=126 /DNA_END=905 /DNA_ORIENTATION=+
MPDYAIELHNVGVAAIEVGSTGLALDVLKVALDAKLSEMSTNETSDAVVDEEFQQQSLQNARFQLSQLVHSTKQGEETTTASSKPDSRTMNRQDAVYIYQRPIALPVNVYREEDDANDDEESSTSNSAVESATMLYNIALVYHSRGLSEQNGVFIQKALSFYKMSLELVKDVLNDASPGAQGAAAMVDSRLVMAVLNNLGQIYHVLGQFNASKDLFNHLSRILVSMCVSGDNLCVDGSDWAGLVLNTMIMHDTKVAPAA